MMKESPSITNTTMLMLLRPFLVVEHATLQVRFLRSGGVISILQVLIIFRTVLQDLANIVGVSTANIGTRQAISISDCRPSSETAVRSMYDDAVNGY